MEQNVKKKVGNQQLDFVDVFWKIAYGWRIILLCAILGTLAGGIYKCISNYNYNRAVEVAEEAQKDVFVDDLDDFVDLVPLIEDGKVSGSSSSLPQSSLTEVERNNIYTALSYANKIKQLESYTKGSLYYNLDAYAVHSVTTQYYINTGYFTNANKDIAPDYGIDLVNAYTSYISRKGVALDIADEIGWGLNEQYLSELILSSESGNYSFQIVVMADSQEKAEELATVVEQKIENYKSKLVKTIGKHSLTVVDQYSGVGPNQELLSLQQSIMTSFITYRTQLVNLTATFSEAQKEVYKAQVDEKARVEEIEETEQVEEQAQVTNQKLSLGKKVILYCILGFLAGGTVGVIIILLLYIFNSCIKTADELSKMFDVFLLGDFEFFQERNGRWSRIDRWIDNKRNRQKLTIEEQLEFAVVNIKILSKKYDVTHLLITSSYHMEDRDMEYVKELKTRLEGQGISIEIAGELPRNALARELAAEIGKIVLVEKTLESRYEIIEKCRDICDEQGCTILGAIAL